MKKFLLVAFLCSIAGYSQQLTYATGGTVYGADGQKIKPMAVRELLKINPEALKLYNAGRQKKTIGNVFFYGGIGAVASNLIIAMYSPLDQFNSAGEYQEQRANLTLAVVGGGMILASIPIKMGYTKKVKAAINQYNQDVVSNNQLKPNITLVANGNGLGVAINF